MISGCQNCTESHIFTNNGNKNIHGIGENLMEDCDGSAEFLRSARFGEVEKETCCFPVRTSKDVGKTSCTKSLCNALFVDGNCGNCGNCGDVVIGQLLPPLGQLLILLTAPVFLSGSDSTDWTHFVPLVLIS